MIEGWHNEDYVILFDASQFEQLGGAYCLTDSLPGFRIVGLKGWDDFIVCDAAGATFTVSTVPIDARHLAPFIVPPANSLKSDSRYAGRIKWYVQPIIFGGSPHSDENITWIDIMQHAAAVKWWNKKYRELTATAS